MNEWCVLLLDHPIYSIYGAGPQHLWLLTYVCMYACLYVCVCVCMCVRSTRDYSPNAAWLEMGLQVIGYRRTVATGCRYCSGYSGSSGWHWGATVSAYSGLEWLIVAMVGSC